MRAHGDQRRVGLLRRNDGHDLALVGDVEGIDSEKIARPGHRWSDRQQNLVEHDREIGVSR